MKLSKSNQNLNPKRWFTRYLPDFSVIPIPPILLGAVLKKTVFENLLTLHLLPYKKLRIWASHIFGILESHIMHWCRIIPNIKLVMMIPKSLRAERDHHMQSRTITTLTLIWQ